MSRYTEPRLKKMRSLGTQLPGLSRKSIERRPYPPGAQGQSRKKISEYGLRLKEVQKLRFNYGVSERQLRRIVLEARRRPGNTASIIAQLLERRLDNAVFRAGFAPTIPAGRQLVNHGHILVNGRKVDIASFRVKVGHQLAIHARSKDNEHILSSLAQPSLKRPSWLQYDANRQTAEVVSLPDEESISFPVLMSLVIEFYAARV